MPPDVTDMRPLEVTLVLLAVPATISWPPDDTKFRGKIAGFTGSGFSDSDKIDLATVAFGSTTSLTYAGSTLTVTDGAHVARLAMIGTYAQANFQMANDGSGYTLITYSLTT